MKRRNAKTLMFLGTGSDVGKSVLAAAFCRILRQDGFRVAPFKAQNMALNSFITPEGGEMGRAQVVQAEAAGIEPHVDMNPILLKPTSQVGSQVIVLGKAAGNFTAKDYYRVKRTLVPVVREAFERLSARYDVIVLEGAGSAVELNLKEHDLVNMAMAEMADAPCILVGDIDRGGIFASLLGSLMLLEASERDRLIGFMVNKLRGDPALFESGVAILEARSGKPVLGVVPYFDHIAIAEEDSVALTRRMKRKPEGSEGAAVRIGVLRLPYVSNYTDFDCFEQEPAVDLVYFDRPAEVFTMDAVILPGSKNTLEDLAHLHGNGVADALVAFHKAGGVVVGVCGGFQMLGTSVRDPHGVESRIEEVRGLGLLPMVTEMFPEKITTQVKVRAEPGNPIGAGGRMLLGYEIHMGRSRSLGDGARPLFRLIERNREPVPEDEALEGLATPDGRAWGTYLHGIFDNDAFRREFIGRILSRSGRRRSDAEGGPLSYATWKEEQFDRLAEHVRRHCDVERIYRLAGIR